MHTTYKSVGDEIANLSQQWQTLAPGVSFGDSTLEEFNTLVKPSLDARAAIAQLESQIESQMKARDQADRISHPEVLRIAGAIHGSKQFGPNSGLYKELGYVTDDERKSGLHRGSASAPAATPAPGAN